MRRGRPGAVQPFSGLAGLGPVAARLTRRLALACALLYGVFGLVATWLVWPPCDKKPLQYGQEPCRMDTS